MPSKEVFDHQICDPHPETASIVEAGGEMGLLMQEKDWTSTPLGPVEQWPQSLKTAISIALHSRYSMFIWWGKDLTYLYNDAYKPTLGPKHPWALGRSAREVWAEIWPEIGPRAEAVIATGKATYDEGLLLFLERYGYPEETYHTFSYSPIPNPEGGVEGVFCAVAEETERIISERRLALLRELATQTADTRSLEETCLAAAHCLATNDRDFPFSLIYLLSKDGQEAHLVDNAQAANPPKSEQFAAPETISLSSESLWPLAKVVATDKPQLVQDLQARFNSLPTGAWDKPPDQAIVLPIAQPGHQAGLYGFLVLGLNPHRPFDPAFQGFVELVASQIATSMTNVWAYQEERKRAEALAEIDRAKTAFFSNISHEFRTPLTLMLGPLEDALNDQDAIADNQERLALAHRNALRLQKLVNSLLDFSRIEAGRVQAAYQPTDLSELTREMAGMFRSAIEKAGLKLKIDCPPLPEPVYVDRDMWEKVILNLLSNAFKHTFEGEIAVSLRWLGNEAQLTVRDTGVGIPADQLPRLFERFHRVPNAQSRTHEGTGIGLALIHELVKLHGGAIQIHSVVAEGTTFMASIPTGKAHLPAERVEAKSTLASTALGSQAFVEEARRWLPGEADHLSYVKQDATLPNAAGEVWRSTDPAKPEAKARLVLADDNADMRDYVRRLLAPYCEVEAVSDGQAAWEAARRNPPDLVLSDVMMPRLDGFELLHAVRNDPALQSVPVILLSARAGEESKIEGLQAGADDYLTKPFSGRELLARVRTNLDLYRVRREAQEAVRESEIRFRTMADTAPVMIWMSDPTAEVVYMNRGLREFFGLDEQQTSIDWEGLGFVHPDDLAFVQKTYYDAFESQKPYSFEARHRRQDGIYRWFLAGGTPRYSPEGLFSGFIGTAVDITERKQLEQGLRTSEEHYRFVSNTTPVMLWITDENHHCTYLNQTWLDFTGQTLEEGLGFGWLDVTHPDDKERAGQIFLEAANRQGPFAVDYRLRGKDGTYHWAFDCGAPLINEDGKFQGYTGYVIDITDRKQAEGRVTRLIETDILGVLFWNEGGQITDANDALLKLIGYTRSELETGLIDWKVLTPPEFAQLDMKAVADVKEKGSARPYEKQFFHKNGNRIDILIGGVGLEDTRDGGLAFVLDITSRKRVEAALKESEERFKNLANSAPVMIWLAEVDAQVTFWNQTWLDYTDQTLEKALGQAWAEVVHPDDYQDIYDLYVANFATRSRFKKVMRIRGKDGDYRWFLSIGSPRYLPNGEFNGYIGTITDIHDGKQAEEALKESQERFKVAVAAVSGILWTNNAQGEMEGEQPGWAALTGQTYEAYQGHGWAKAIHPDDAQPTIDAWHAAVRERKTFIFEHRVCRHDGVWRHFSIRAIPALDAEGAIREWVGVHTDITEQKELTEALQEAKEAAELANRKKSEFLAMMSHELRTPLNAILGYSRMMEMEMAGPVNDKQGQYLKNVGDSGQHLLTIINDLLDVSKIEAGKMDITPEWIALKPVVAEVQSMMEELAARKNVRLQIQANVAAMQADPARFKQILVNLINNAIKFNRDGGDVWVTLNQQDGWLLGTVKDTGIGIPKEKLPKLFSKFYQVDNSRSRQHEGTGLGLALSRELIELHGGTIWVESEEGVGATFTFRMPIFPLQGGYAGSEHAQ